MSNLKITNRILQESVVSTPLGTLKVNVIWQAGKLIVDVLSASGLTPLDSNGEFLNLIPSDRMLPIGYLLV